MSAAAAVPDYPIYDSHVHVWDHKGGFPFAPGAKVPEENASPETLLELMAGNGIAKTVIIQVIHYLYDNSYLADVLRRYPNKFVGVCRVDPLDPAAPNQLSQLTEQGFEGVRLSPAGDTAGDWIRGPLMPPLWKRCEYLGVPMTVLAPITRMEDVRRLVEHCPNLTVVIDHMADCPVDQPEKLTALLALARYPKVFVKISHTWSLSRQSYPWLDAQELVKRLYGGFGPQRLMWGTDWPIAKDRATYSQRLTVVRDQMNFLSNEDKLSMLSKTVSRVWPKLNRS
jgi:predicted TIM-barrel fold metal-dependent hydrolase